MNLSEAIPLTRGNRNPISNSGKISRALTFESQLATHTGTQLALFGIDPVGASLLKHDSPRKVAELAIRLKLALKEIAPAE